jgi:DnaK suppressor protein
MGKSDHKKPVKKTVPKPVVKAGMNGRSTSAARAPVKIAPPVIAKRSTKMRARNSSITLPEGYQPSESEPFMNERHRAYFRNKLVAWKEEIIRQNRETLHVLHEDSSQHADLADRATSETDRALELRARDRQRKLVNKIDAALARIEDGSYGFCEDTGEPIGLKRLDARPIATLSLEAQEAHERREKVFRED